MLSQLSAHVHPQVCSTQRLKSAKSRDDDASSTSSSTSTCPAQARCGHCGGSGSYGAARLRTKPRDDDASTTSSPTSTCRAQARCGHCGGSGSCGAARRRVADYKEVQHVVYQPDACCTDAFRPKPVITTGAIGSLVVGRRPGTMSDSRSLRLTRCPGQVNTDRSEHYRRHSCHDARR